MHYLMGPIYTDIHIHTSDNPDSINTNYNVSVLADKITAVSGGAHCLISLTDHNTINKKAYLDFLNLGRPSFTLLLGVELHVHNYPEAPAYHCHAIFKSPITEEQIDKINAVLDELYPHKVVSRTSSTIPTLDKIIRKLDDFEFMLLPHGGQSHSTFDESIPAGVRFDTTIERSIYYNQFEGYTARSRDGLENTILYFQRLGIHEFINLVTCSDNYDPMVYPNAKDPNASPFIPTWMFAEPSFDGLRLSLSESSRFKYSDTKPNLWAENIKKVVLNEPNITIDVTLTPGLNVVIGGSSSGKTLFVDSIWRKTSNKPFTDSSYNQYNVSNIVVSNPSGFEPHFISQNYIMRVVNTETADNIQDIDIIKRVFPFDSDFRMRVEHSMASFRENVSALIECVEKIETEQETLKSIPHIGSLFILNDVPKNMFLSLKPSGDQRNRISYAKANYDKHIKFLEELESLLSENPFARIHAGVLAPIREELNYLFRVSSTEACVYRELSNAISEYDEELKASNVEEQTKSQQQVRLLTSVKNYVSEVLKFRSLLDRLASYNISASSKEVTSMGHHLYIENKFELSRDKIVEVFNSLLKNRVASYDEITPESLFKANYKQRAPKVDGYEGFVEKACSSLNSENKAIYKITTKDGKDFDSLSAGWKTSVLLDLIFGYVDDIAPIIIDQPEDNLATNYINDGLVRAIKQIKDKKQVILVSHNATIPMMADAQNIVYCENVDGRISIRSAPLEGVIGDKSVLDLVATITDGGKSSIKKRVKKYNLKKYKS